MQGRRLYTDGTGFFYADKVCQQKLEACEPGDYWTGPLGWAAKLPNGLRCGLSKHTVTEHEDGTITVSPSILTTNGEGGESWHGFLEKGVWREC